MVRRMEAGASFDEVIARGEENKLKIAHRFTVDDLKYLKMGGPGLLAVFYLCGGRDPE